ncbi:Obp73a family protein [Megaselia abdita]
MPTTPNESETETHNLQQSGVTSLWNMIKYYLICLIAVGTEVHGFWFFRRSSSSPEKPAKCPEVPNTKEKVEMGIKQCQDSVRNKLISEAYGLYKSKFEEDEHKSVNFFESTKVIKQESPSHIESANLEFESEEALNKFLEKVKSENHETNVVHKPLDIPKEVAHLPLDDSFSKVHDQDQVWGTTPATPHKIWTTPVTSHKEWASTFAPTLESYASSSSNPSPSLQWDPLSKNPEYNLVQHFSSQVSVKPSETTEPAPHDFWGNLRKAQKGSLNFVGDQKGPIYDKLNMDPINYTKSKFEEVKLPMETQKFVDSYFNSKDYILQENFHEPMKYHNFHSTDFSNLGHKQPKNLFDPMFKTQQHYTKEVFVPAQDHPKNIFVPQNPQSIFQPTQMEYPENLFNSATKQFQKDLFQPAPTKNLFYPANSFQQENFFMSQDQFQTTSNNIHHQTTSLQPNPAILSIWEDAKRNKKHSRHRRSTKKIYHPNLLSTEDKRLAGCLLNCVYEKYNVLDSNGWPTLEGLLQFYSEGIHDQNFFMTIFRASDVCLKSFRSKYKYKQKRQDYGDSCDVAFEVFDCVADQITGYCSEKI